MKTFFCSVLLSLLMLTFSVFAQTSKEVTTIRNEVAKINKNVKTYKKTTKDVEGISLEGTEAIYFTSGKRLKKITAKIYGETYNASAELYYQGDELIFVYQKMNRYDTQIGQTPPPKVVKVEEKRFYFVGEKLTKLLVGKNDVKKKSKQWENSESDIADLAKKLREAFGN